MTESGFPSNHSEDRIVTGSSMNEEREVDAALRPRSLADFVGQHRVRNQLSLVLEAAKLRGATADHILLSGPPGLGKTTLSMIVAEEMNAPLRISSGPAIQHSGDLAAILSSLTEGEVLFLDEIHRMSRPAEEMLYMAMEDFRVDIIVGKGAGATSIPLELPHFTIVAATTRAGLLPGPLRDRFGFTGHLDFYSTQELEMVLRRSAAMLEIKLSNEAFTEIASRSRGTPRIANRLLRRVRDWALVNNLDAIDARSAAAALEMYEVDTRGLDRLDRAVLEALCTKFHGGPVGLSTLAIAVGEEIETVETVAEPYLVREGLLGRTPRGRIAMPSAWEHLGLVPPENSTSHGFWSLMPEESPASVNTTQNAGEQESPEHQNDLDGVLYFDDSD